MTNTSQEAPAKEDTLNHSLTSLMSAKFGEHFQPKDPSFITYNEQV